MITGIYGGFFRFLSRGWDLSPSLLVAARRPLKSHSRETELDPHGLCDAGYDWRRGDENLAINS
jgi:hypothetical protein